MAGQAGEANTQVTQVRMRGMINAGVTATKRYMLGTLRHSG
jgi:hypothetical protein